MGGVDDGRDLEGRGFRAPTACAAAGITQRQLDYWARTRLVEPSAGSREGSRLYSVTDIVVLRCVARLLDTGVSLPRIRTAVKQLRDRGPHRLREVTLTGDEPAFRIALGPLVAEVTTSLSGLPGERVGNSPEGDGGDDPPPSTA